MARRSCPLEGFEQCDTVFDQLNDLNRVPSRPRILGSLGLDLFSKSPITKHCKWDCAGFVSKARVRLGGFDLLCLARDGNDRR
jgi:hypothetical protein